MTFFYPSSLMKTIDNFNERILFSEPISQEEKLEATRWILTQQGKKGSYRKMFAPTDADFEQGIRLFTGERLQSASARHIMGQEAARLIWLFGSADPIVRAAHERASDWMADSHEFQETGTFCCGRCTLAFWRHFRVGNFENKTGLISKGLQTMKQYRFADGKWSRYPFFYSIYTLVDLDLTPAREELTYARPLMERYLKHPREGTYSKRRIRILQRALEITN